MVTKAEDNFIAYWEKHRESEKKTGRQLLFGLPFGLLLGACIILMLQSGWYERATMVAYSQSSPWVLVVAIVAVSVFIGFFYKKYKWEMNETRYRELIHKKKQAGN
jgi:hypothetical protein